MYRYIIGVDSYHAEEAKIMWWQSGYIQIDLKQINFGVLNMLSKKINQILRVQAWIWMSKETALLELLAELLSNLVIT